MKKRMLIGFAAVALIGMGWLLFSRMHTPESMPVYKGKTARQWLREITTTNQNAAMEAFSQMDTNALPFLVNTFHEVDPPAERLYQAIYPKLPNVLQRRVRKPMANWERCWAASAILELQPQWLPRLTEWLSDPSAEKRSLAAVALGQIGDAAKPAIPNLTICLQDSDVGVRVDAAMALYNTLRITNGMPALKQVAMTSEGHNRMKAVVALSGMDCTDPELLPVFAKSVNSGDRSLSFFSILALANYGPVAKEAVPLLIQRYHRGNSADRRIILEALKKIDPKSYEELTGQRAQSP